MAGETNGASPVVDEEYKTAIQPVIDNNMRTDILGPHFCRVLENHTPASNAITTLIAKELCKDPELKKSVKGIVTEFYNENKLRWIDRSIGVGGTIILGVVMWTIYHFLGKLPN